MNKTIMKTLIICMILSILTFNEVNEYSGGNIQNVNQLRNFDKHLSSSYTPRSPILIISNSQFDSIATSNGWDGDGSQAFPYIIEGYSITGIYQLIEIRNTDKYFIIRDNLLDGENFQLDGIYFFNVANGIVQNNIIQKNRHGIYLDTGCTNILLQRNNISNSAESGIRFNNTNANQIIDNQVLNSTYNGIWLNSSNNNLIHDNALSNQELGIWLRDDSNSNNITRNTIIQAENSILLSNYSSENRLIGNTLANNSQCGLKVSDFANNNEILNNTMENFFSFGAILNQTSYNNYFSGNNFINNNAAGSSQAYDNGTDNTFEYNYWDDWADGAERKRGALGEAESEEGSGVPKVTSLVLKKNFSLMLLYGIT